MNNSSTNHPAKKQRALLSCPSGRAYQLLRPLPTSSLKPGVTLYEARPLDHSAAQGCSTPQRLVVKRLRLSCTPRAAEELAAMEALGRGGVGGSPNKPAAAASHVVPLLDAVAGQRHLYLVMPLMEGGDLFDRVVRVAEGGRALAPQEARRHFKDMIAGLLELKACGIAHGDVSLENVVLSSDGRSAHLIDLGSSLTEDSGPRGYGGKPAYCPPEACGKCLDAGDRFASDVWSLGICLYVMMCGSPLYISPADPAFTVLASGHAGLALEHYQSLGVCLDQQAVPLIRAMLHADPRLRPTLEEVLMHPWVQGCVAPDGAGTVGCE